MNCLSCSLYFSYFNLPLNHWVKLLNEGICNRNPYMDFFYGKKNDQKSYVSAAIEWGRLSKLYSTIHCLSMMHFGTDNSLSINGSYFIIY
jgi:hypothetical protein